MYSPFLVILSGLPSAGKSTLAREIAKIFENRFNHSTVIVGSDNFRSMIPTYQRRFEPELEEFVRNVTYEAIKVGLRSSLLVISDDTNYYTSIRRHLVRIAQRFRVNYAIIFVDTPLDSATEWNKERGEPIPNSLIEEMNYKMDEPGERYKWDKPLMVVDPSKNNIAQIAESLALKINEKAGSKGTPYIEKKGPKPKSLSADIERETRRAMGEVMKRFKNLSLATDVSQARKNVVKTALEKKLSAQEAVDLFFEKSHLILSQTPKEVPAGQVMVHVGLFGHVDHGKTKLAACLTEKPSTASLDKHPEAQRRGMSIDMGFSAFQLDKYFVTLVDLPGHYSLIKHVVAGANIIDAGILVVAADEGPKAQTKEHLQILNALGIKKIVVAANKIDLVNQQRLNVAKEEIKTVLAGSRYEGSPIVAITSTKCEGMDELRTALLGQLSLPIRHWSGKLKVPIDHAFSIVGIGTVITGTILRGKLKLGDKVEIRPINRQCRVKLIQIFGQNVEEASAGDRVGLALSGVRPSDLSRGDVIVSPGSLQERSIFESRFNVEEKFGFNIEAGSIVHISLGLQTVRGKIFPYVKLKEAKVLKKRVDQGTASQALITLEKPTPVEKGDKALIMKIDLSPKQVRVIGLAEVINLPEKPPKLYSAKIKYGSIREKTSDSLYVVSGLFQTKIASQHMVGKNVVSSSKIKGTIVSAHGNSGDVLVKFERPPNTSEKVYYYKLKTAKTN